MSLVQTTVEEFEETRDSATATLLSHYKDVLAQVGDRPAYFDKPSTLEKLSLYLEVRDQPQAWAAIIADEATRTAGDLFTAEIRVIKEANRLEALLWKNGGPESVVARSTMIRLKGAEKIIDRAERWESKPRWEIAPPVRIPTQEEIVLAGLMPTATVEPAMPIAPPLEFGREGVVGPETDRTFGREGLPA